MGWECITGVLDDTGPFWAYTTIDCDTQLPAIAIAQPNLSNGDCGNPQGPSCWPTSPAALAAGKTRKMRVIADDMSELNTAMARLFATKFAAIDDTIQLEE